MTLAEIKLMFYTCTVMVISSHYSSYALISLLIQSVFFSSCCCNAFVWKSPHSELSGCSCIKAEVRKCTFEIVHPKTKMYYPFTLFFFSFENTRRCFEECQKPSTSIVGKQILWQSFFFFIFSFVFNRINTLRNKGRNDVSVPKKSILIF